MGVCPGLPKDGEYSSVVHLGTLRLRIKWSLSESISGTFLSPWGDCFPGKLLGYVSWPTQTREEWFSSMTSSDYETWVLVLVLTLHDTSLTLARFLLAWI